MTLNWKKTTKKGKNGTLKHNVIIKSKIDARICQQRRLRNQQAGRDSPKRRRNPSRTWTSLLFSSIWRLVFCCCFLFFFLKKMSKKSRIQQIECKKRKEHDKPRKSFVARVAGSSSLSFFQWRPAFVCCFVYRALAFLRCAFEAKEWEPNKPMELQNETGLHGRTPFAANASIWEGFPVLQRNWDEQVF